MITVMEPRKDEEIFRFGTYELDSSSGEIRKSGIKLRLPEQAFQILWALLERPGEIVTREQLRLRLWPDGTFVDYDHGLNTLINRDSNRQLMQHNLFSSGY